jgi:hypothetical protein
MVERARVIEHHNRLTAGPENAMYLGYGRVDVGNVVQHTHGIDEIEAPIGEWQLGGGCPGDGSTESSGG